jgi:ferredoxin
MATYRFHVFSGTGNSMHLARAVAARIGARAAAEAAASAAATAGSVAAPSFEFVEVSEAEIAKLRRARKGGSAGGDGGEARGDRKLDVFLFPVFAMSMPRIMRRYIGALGPAEPAGAGGERPRAAVLSTNGRISAEVRDGHEGESLACAERMLRRRGWDVAYRDSFDYPQSISSVLKIQDESRKAAIMSLVEPRIEELAGALASGERRKRPCAPWALLVGWPFGQLYSIFGRRFLAMLFAADASCDGCGLCARRCPAGAIRMLGRVPDWSYACEGCERCINVCPKGAIQTSIARIAVLLALWILLETSPLKPLLASVSPSWLFGVAWFVATVVVGLAALRLVDLVLVTLARSKAIRGVLGFGWTKWTGRYRAPDATRP